MSVDGTKKLLLVFALKKEIAPDFFKKENLELDILITGMGKLNASLSLIKKIDSLRDELGTNSQLNDEFLFKNKVMVVNLGTAGSLKFPVGELVEVDNVYQRDSVFHSPKISVCSYTNLPKVSCGSGDSIEKLFPESPWDIVDMEAYALARVCQEKGISFVSIKYITDNSNENVKEQWNRQVEQASKVLYQFWMKYLNKNLIETK